jgi:hypothetical protein
MILIFYIFKERAKDSKTFLCFCKILTYKQLAYYINSSVERRTELIIVKILLLLDRED